MAERVTIHKIIEAIQASRVKISDHADDEATEDNLLYGEIRDSVIRGEIIRNYPDDKPYPSCLVFGMNEKEEPVHSVWAYNRESEWAVLITVYRPDPGKWINWRERKNEQEDLR